MKNIGKNQRRLKQNPLEEIFAKEWDMRNDPHKIGAVLDMLLADTVNEPNGEVTERDREVAATVVQWLGSPVGESFVRGVMERWEIKIREQDRVRRKARMERK